MYYVNVKREDDTHLNLSFNDIDTAKSFASRYNNLYGYDVTVYTEVVVFSINKIEDDVQ